MTKYLGYLKRQRGREYLFVTKKYKIPRKKVDVRFLIIFYKKWFKNLRSETTLANLCF